jgi:hypothetical protein
MTGVDAVLRHGRFFGLFEAYVPHMFFTSSFHGSSSLSVLSIFNQLTRLEARENFIKII